MHGVLNEADRVVCIRVKTQQVGSCG